MRLPNVCDICSFNKNDCKQNHYVCDAVSEAYQQGRADAWSETEEIIKSKTNPIQTIELLISKIKEGRE